VQPSALVGALPLLVAWWVAPALAIWTARARQRKPRIEIEIDRAPLRRLARRTWAYFETVIGPGDHWLPPDNIQAPPHEATAHRTSPTNIAMGLLATIAAHDLGYIDLLELVFRLRNTLSTLEHMPNYRGHVLNWVDTQTLEPLEPRYVSTVDSGNLAAALLIVEQACREFAVEARPVRGRFVGLADSLDVLDETLMRWGESAGPLLARVAVMRAAVAAASDDPMTWSPSLAALDDQAFASLEADLLALFEAKASTEADPERFEELSGWAMRIQVEVGGVRSELEAQLPWIALLAELPESVPEHQRAEFEQLRAELREVPRLGRTPALLGSALERLASLRAGAQAGPVAWQRWLERLAEGIETSRVGAERIAERLEELAGLARDRLAAMDFAFLYDRERALLYIGYDVSSERYDAHHYDLLASEARLTSLLAIAKGDAPLRHWAKLGRPIGRFGGARGLLSWSRTMFEYLLPPLLVDEGHDTLLDVSARAAIQAQIAWGRKLGLPWGVSESGYAKFDAHHHYQYRAFGVPSTGFRRGLQLDRVVAPYASVIALGYAPVEVAANLVAIQAAGGCGPLGLFEAIDYTRERIGIGNDHEVVRSYMSHHQGMVMLALHGYLNSTTMARRMHRDPALRAVELLLHERSPGRVPVEQPQPAEQGPPAQARAPSVQGWPADSPAAVDAHVFSNGRFGVLVTRAGTGHSWWKDVAITRPCLDPTLQDIGSILYLRDEDHDHRWCSRVHAGAPVDASREVMFTPQGATITIHQHGLVAEFTTTIAPSVDAELRFVRLSDRSGRRRQLTITSYAEIVLGNALEYERHPAFAKLFVDSQVLVSGERATLLFRRRPRGPGEPESWLACAMISDQPAWSRFETDRDRFLGRARSLEDPAARMQPLPGEDGPMAATLDTCAAMSGRLELAAGGTYECAFVSVFGRSRTEVLERAGRLATMAAVRRNSFDAERVAVARASERGQDTAALRGHQRLLSALLYPRPELRECDQSLGATLLGQPALWRHGISGDLAILVVRMVGAGLGCLVRLLDAHSHWFERGVAVDLVILDDRPSSYDASPRQRIAQVLEQASARVGLPGGGVFVIDGAGLGDAERSLLLGCASVVLDADADVERALARVVAPALPSFDPEGQPRLPTPSLARPVDLQFDNGYGGFSPDGREYVVHLDPDRQTPAPWVNVIANPDFGCVVSERGIGYAWSVNAGLRRLTPWSNDAVLDPPSTSIYLRDELGGAVWSPMPAPAPAPAPYQTRHGAGYTIFTHASHGLDQRVEVFVAPTDPVVIIELQLADSWERPRRLTVTLCIEWLLGSRRADARTLVTEFVPEHEVVLVANSWNPTFAERCAFARASVPLHGITTSREEFFGRAGDRRSPAALGRIGLSGEIVPGADPCAALQVHVDLPAGGATTLHFVFGDGEDRAAALALAERYREPDQVDAARRERDQVWNGLLGCVQVESPDPGFDLQVNHWLLYQAIAARMWGRTGFNQSSGAFGFRDQLQDKLALTHAAPEQLRAHLLDAASRQFVEGDVLHWWHPPSGQGLRSRCSDDLLWLPYATAHYVAATGDTGVLAEPVALLDGPRLAPDQHELYSNEFTSSSSATLYDHCMRALEHADTRGAHQLPLIGGSDWNDGFSHVGRAGRGESVWLGWFMRACTSAFARVAERLGRLDDARELDRRAAALLEPLAAAWDGAWYLRAFDDDGDAIGGAGNRACAIDSIAQSWAVISSGCDRARATTAMQSVWDRLVDLDADLIRLFTPPFETAEARVGYVEGYPPGVRENGGQYTHAAVWVAWAFAELGEIDRAWTLARMLSPLAHSSDPQSIEHYRVEPYVVAADIAAAPPHTGRGGWTWYTGAAGWSYRLAVEQLLGVLRVEGKIQLAPTLPRDWPSCLLVLRDGNSVHRVRIEKRGNGARVIGFRVDGVDAPLPAIVPSPDGRDHELLVTLD
jgi:cyclic beta-1,2-glucan synthetase